MENGKTKILIVDDRRDKLLVFQTILEELGQTILIANSGKKRSSWSLSMSSQSSCWT